ncbi:isochorismatase family protein [Antrihabitans spumae]|uniref:Isochorismatase family protein n=1 Tax=Antrihabitans spumae TaxID=3373370 RepID=A0ABW7KGL4_9NOCA
MASPRRALIVIDVQQEYFDGPLEVEHPPRERSLANIGAIVEAADAAGIPVIAVQHVMGEGAPVFVEGTPGYALHPDIEKRLTTDTKRVQKQFGSVFAGTDVAEWLRERDIDTVTLVGFMTNNCDLATAVEAEGLGIAAEVISDATGAINLANAAGSASAETVHTVLMTLLHSNFAAVATTKQWIDAVSSGSGLDKSNLVESAIAGRAAATA